MMLKTLQRFKSKNGLAFTKTGEGLPIVLVHGVGLRAESWMHQIECLSQTNTVYAVDMPGHGESDLLADESAGLEEYVDAIALWVDTQIKAPVVMLGHSMGSMIALNFAARYSKLCMGVGALNSVYRRTPEAKKAVKQRALDIVCNPESVSPDAPIERWFSNTHSEFEQKMAHQCRHWLVSAPKKGYARAYAIFSENNGPQNESLKALEVPVTFITGDGDTNSSAKMSEQMAALCKQGSFAIISNSKHMVQMTHPQQMNTLLTAFITQCENKNAQEKGGVK